jgi:hypothetical protein
MAPKTPNELREQVEAENKKRPAKGASRTAEGMETPDPKRSAFFSNLKKASRTESPIAD